MVPESRPAFRCLTCRSSSFVSFSNLVPTSPPRAPHAGSGATQAAAGPVDRSAKVVGGRLDEHVPPRRRLDLPSSTRGCRAWCRRSRSSRRKTHCSRFATGRCCRIRPRDCVLATSPSGVSTSSDLRPLPPTFSAHRPLPTDIGRRSELFRRRSEIEREAAVDALNRLRGNRVADHVDEPADGAGAVSSVPVRERLRCAPTTRD